MFGEGKYLVAKVVLMMETPKRIAKNWLINYVAAVQCDAHYSTLQDRARKKRGWRIPFSRAQQQQHKLPPVSVSLWFSHSLPHLTHYHRDQRLEALVYSLSLSLWDAMRPKNVRSSRRGLLSVSVLPSPSSFGW
jgi:hypothetical protein